MQSSGIGHILKIDVWLARGTWVLVQVGGHGGLKNEEGDWDDDDDDNRGLIKGLGRK